MLRVYGTVMTLIVSHLLACCIAHAGAMLSVGQRLELRAFRAEGVPLYREPHSPLVERAPHQSTAVIRAMSDHPRWLNVEIEADGRSGWVVTKYVNRILPPLPEGDLLIGPSTPSEAEWKVWHSAVTCEQVVDSGQRMAPQHPDVLRLATWRLRGFPDGAQDRPTPPGSAPQPTDLRWLTCVLTWMNIDIVALQGLRTTPAAQDAWEVVTDGLNAWTGDLWVLNTQVCGGAETPKIGYLWNISRVGVTNPQDLWPLTGQTRNGAPQPCPGPGRPGRYATLKGMQREGVDLHLVTLHLDVGKVAPPRQTALTRIDEVVAPFLAQDADGLIVATFDPMGADRGETASEAIDAVRQFVPDEPPGFTRLETTPACSAYVAGRAVQLDYLFVATGMAEAPPISARVTGMCARHACQDAQPLPPANRYLSNHCPVVYAITNRDQD